MNWGKIFKSAAKSALILGVIGGLLAVAAPALGAMVGFSAPSGLAFVGYNALFFAGFGALSEVVTPVVKSFLGEKPEAAEKKEVTVNFVVEHKGQAPSQDVTVNHTVNNDVDIAVQANVAAASHAPATVVTDAQTRSAVLLGENASQAIH